MFCYVMDIFWDILLFVSFVIFVWLGDMLVVVECVWWMEVGLLVNVVCLMLLLYMGVYCDVLLYYDVDGVLIGVVLFDIYFGLCCVIYCIGVVLVVCLVDVEVVFDGVLLCVLLCMYVCVVVE